MCEILRRLEKGSREWWGEAFLPLPGQRSQPLPRPKRKRKRWNYRSEVGIGRRQTRCGSQSGRETEERRKEWGLWWQGKDKPGGAKEAETSFLRVPTHHLFLPLKRTLIPWQSPYPIEPPLVSTTGSSRAPLPNTTTLGLSASTYQ